MRKQPHFSSLRMDWKTPKAVYQVLDAEFGFDFDPCPPKPTFDGLAINWGGELCEPTIRPRTTKMDQERLRGMAERQNRRLSHSLTHRYYLVARLLYEGVGNSLYPWSPKVRRSTKPSTISECHCNFQKGRK